MRISDWSSDVCSSDLVFLDEVRLPAANLVGDVNRGWGLAKVTLGNERVSLSSGGALWGMGPAADELFDVVRAAGGVTNPDLRQRLADLHLQAELLRHHRPRTVTARIITAERRVRKERCING